MDTKRIFPLHLSPFEHYMFLDDSPEYPMTFVEQYAFSGAIDREAFERAYQEALDRHPLLSAVIRPAKANRDCWVAGQSRPAIDWGGLDDALTLPRGEFINLREEPGLRVWFRHDDRRAVMTLQFHHATADGIGSYQFLGDLLQGYARRTGGSDVPDLVPLDPKSLRDRNRSGFEPLMTNDQMEYGYRELWEFMKRRIAPVAPPRDSAGRRPSAGFPGIRSYSFDKDAYKQLRLGCQREGLTVNDALVAELFLTLRDWNRANSRAILPRGLCIMVPMDLRRPDEPVRTACNCVTYALLRRTHKELQDASGVADFVRQEMTRLKTERYFTGFAKLMVMARWNPPMARLVLRSPKCFASAIVSNTGDPTKSFYAPLPRVGGRVQCGNLILESVSGVPPLRKNSRVTISIFTYLRELKICMRCSPHHFSEQGTQQLLDAFVARLQALGRG